MPILSGPISVGPLPDLEVGIDAASQAVVRNACGWHVYPCVSQSFVYRSEGEKSIKLPTLQLVSAAVVDESGTVVSDGDYTAWPWGVLEHRTCWPVGCLQITLVHGYDSCPPEVTAVVKQFARTGLGVERVKTEVEGPYQTTYFEDDRSIDAYAAVLSPYRIPPGS